MESRREQGFTLIELMVVVLVIAILLAVAVPTFLGAYSRAMTRAAQSNARNAHTSLLIYYTEAQTFTAEPLLLNQIDKALEFVPLLSALDSGPNVHVRMLPDTTRPNDTVVVTAKSGTGRCFWIRAVGGQDQPRFAEDDCSGAALVFKARW